MTLADKVRKFCEYQDRSETEVRRKMAQLLIPIPEREDLLQELIEEKYVDDERFAESFIRGKVNQKRWGRTRLNYELRLKGISDSIITEKMSEIDEETYNKNLEYLIERWKSEHSKPDKQKLFQYLIRKGYQTDEITKALSIKQ